MKALLIVAHGSRKADANRHLQSMAAELESKAKDRFSRVRCAFLQYNGPYAVDTISEMIGDGVNHIVIFPFFLAEGSHVRSDIPELIDRARKDHPAITFESTSFLGSHPKLGELVLDAASET